MKIETVALPAVIILIVATAYLSVVAYKNTEELKQICVDQGGTYVVTKTEVLCFDKDAVIDLK